MPTFKEMMATRVAAGKYVCIGLDPDLSKIPTCVPGETDAARVYNFLIREIDHNHDVAMAYKPQIAFFEALGDDGFKTLRQVIEYIRTTDPSIPVILDYKRGDIMNTNNGYITAAYDYFGVDAVTLHPYLGLEAMAPFVTRPGKMSIILCRTSNKGAGEFQDVICEPIRHVVTGEYFADFNHAEFEGCKDHEKAFRPRKMRMFEYVARRVAQTWSKHGDCALVVGATWADELELVRQIVGNVTILVPGLGKQGGKIEDIIPGALDEYGWGIVPNNASAINFAFNELEENGEKLFPPEQWAEASGFAAETMNESIANRLALAA